VVESNAMNKNSDGNPVHNFFLRVAGENSAPNSNFSKHPELSKPSPTKKLMMHVNTDKANSHRYDITRYRWYMGAKHPQSAHQYVEYIPRSQVQVQISSVELS